MHGLVYIGVLLNVVAVVVAMASFPAWIVPLGALGLPLAGCSVLGAHWLRQGRIPLGAWSIVFSSLGLLPVGGLAALAAYRLLQDARTGLHLGRDARTATRRPRPRAWTLATVVFALIAAACLVYALVLVNAARFDALADLLVVLAVLLVMVLAGIEAALLWNVQPAARRLGAALSAIGLVTLALAGFYLQSYLAVSLLAVPVYAAYLVWAGRDRWTGLRRA